MKFLLPCLTLTLLCPLSSVHAQKLDDKSKAEALKWLEVYKSKINATKRERISAANLALTTAAANEQAAFELYKNTVKQLDFDSKGLPTLKFIEWEKSQKDRFNTPGFKKGLQMNCRWILLGTKLAHTEREAEKHPEMADSKALDPSREIMDLLTAIAASEDIINYPNGLGSDISANIKKSLLINDLTPKNWADSPLSVGQIFDKIIMAKIKKNKDIPKFRSSWLKRIELEKRLVIDPKNKQELDKTLQEGDDKNSRKRPRGIMGQRAGTLLSDSGNDLNDRMRRNKSNKKNDDLANLYWQMEIECYQLGDERTAITALKKYLADTKDPALIEKRVEQLAGILEGQDVVIDSAGSEDMSGAKDASDPVNTDSATGSSSSADSTDTSSSPAPAQPASSGDDWDI